jgi:citrate lyase subunit beta/citryl-CoA lyase
MYRSMLYVPASSERFVAKAASRGADAIILDLEDGVSPEEKLPAREKLAQSVATVATQGAAVLVRINRPLTLAVGDVQAAVRSGADGILIPKVEGPEHICLLVEVAEEEERRAKRSNPLSIIAVIEAPGPVFKAREIATAHPRVVGMQAGGEDLATALDAEATAEALRFPKLFIHLAAKAAGIASYGTLGSVADFADAELIRSLVAEARRHGFDGASCVHPSVVAILNEGFTPSAAAVQHATGLLAAAEAARREGKGAATYQGKMIDEPVFERARRLLARADRFKGKT